MCVIIYTQNPGKIGDKVILNMANHNRDGAGAMWYDKSGELVVEKVLPDSPVQALDFYRYCQGKALESGNKLAFHLRKRTTGEVSIGNVQPMQSGSFFMMHNGTIDGLRPADHVGKSDSYHAARLFEECEAELGAHSVLSKPFIELLGMAASSSRLLIASRAKAPMVMVNPGLWTHIGGHAISNLYAWDSFTLTKGLYGSKEIEERRKKRLAQLNLF